MKRIFLLASIVVGLWSSTPVFALDGFCSEMAKSSFGAVSASCKKTCSALESEINIGNPDPGDAKNNNGIPDDCEYYNPNGTLKEVLKCCYFKAETPTCDELAKKQNYGEFDSAQIVTAEICGGKPGEYKKVPGQSLGIVNLGPTKDSGGNICCAQYKTSGGLVGGGATTCDDFAKKQYSGQGVDVAGKCMTPTECQINPSDPASKSAGGKQFKVVSLDTSKAVEVCGGGICCATITPTSKAPAASTSGGPFTGCKLQNRGPAALALPLCFKDGNCTLDDMVCMGVSFANFLITLSGAAFFATFIYGGALYLLTFMDTSFAAKGKKAMLGAATGMIIVMAAWTIVNYLASAITGIAV